MAEESIVGGEASGTSVDTFTHFGARDVPVPDTVSPDLQRAISAGFKGLEPPYPQTNEEWHSAFADHDEQLKLVARLLDEHALTLEPRDIGGVGCFEIRPAGPTDGVSDKLLINIHGGGFVLGGGKGGTVEAILMCAVSRMPVLTIDYRLAPRFPFPAAIDDCKAVWRHLSSTSDPRRMALFGSSAGGGIILSLIQRSIAEGLPIPAAISVGTPWSDLTKTGDSYFINQAGAQAYDGPLALMAQHYAGALDLRDARLSPIYGKFEGFPPTILTSGTRDIFLSNTVRVDQKLRDEGIETSLLVLEGQAHAAYLDPNLPESWWTFREMHKFLRRFLQ